MHACGSLNHFYRTVWNQALGAMVAVAAGPLLAQSNPTGGVAIQGQATFATSGNHLQVTTQNGAGLNHSAINWQSFSVPAGSSTYFQQPTAASTSINRVVTNTPSLIFGSLGSNGNLVLVNQSGITVGAGAVVDTAGFTASALRMSDADALSGRLRFGEAGAAAGAVSVNGSVLARSGDVVLLGSSVESGSQALVQAPNGSTVLAAGQQIEITGRGLEGIVMQVQAPSDSAVNLGTLSGDAVGIFAGTLKHSGMIQATQVSTQGGKVVLKAAGDTVVDGNARIVAQAANGSGGQIEVLGQRVAVTGNAQLDASGANGGGTVLVGGDYQGKNAAVQNAAVTYLGQQASIKADATVKGDGGKVIVWADDTTRAYGSISARGGAQGGNGGFVETSGHRYLDFQGRVDTSAIKGTSGTLLLDPTNITIGNTADVNVDSSNFGVLTTSPSVNSVLSWATINAQTGNLTVQTNTLSTSGAGDVNITESNLTPLTGPTSLTILAHNDINVTNNVAIDAGGANVSLAAGWNSTGIAVTPGVGNIVFGVGSSLGTTGTVRLYSGGTVTQDSTASIVAAGLGIGSTGSVSLLGANQVGALAANVTDPTSTFDYAAGSTGINLGTVSGVGVASGVHTAGGAISLQADKMRLTGGVVEAGAGIVKLVSRSGLSIDLGSTSDSNAAALELSNAEINAISASQLIIGDLQTTGAIDISGSIAVAAAKVGTLSLQTSGSVTQTAALAAPVLNVDATSGVALTNAGNQIGVFNAFTSGTGDIALNNAGATLGVGTVTANTGNVVISNTGNINLESNQIANVRVDRTYAATLTSGGSISASGGGSPTHIEAGSIHLNAASGIGTATSPVGADDTNYWASLHFSNANGDVFIDSPGPMHVDSSSSGGNITLRAGGDLVLNQLQTLSGNTVSLISLNGQIANADPTQPGAIFATALSTDSASGTQLGNAPGIPTNSVRYYVGTNVGSGNIEFVNAGTFTVGTMNNAGGNWLIYADSPDVLTKGALTSGFRYYGATYADAASINAQSALNMQLALSGNGIIYASTPALSAVNTVLASGSAGHVYANTPNVVLGYTLPGIDKEDVVGNPVWSITPNAGTSAGSYPISYVSGLTLSNTNAYQGSAATPMAFAALSAGTPLVYTVTPRAAATWSGAVSNLWSDSRNWDVLPTGSNVQTVFFSAGASVIYDGAAGTTTLQSISGSDLFSLQGGSLDVSGAFSTNRFAQSGGTLSGSGSFTVGSAFSQSGGSIAMTGPVSITQSSGNLLVGSISAASIRLQALNGSINQSAALSSSGLLKTESTGSTTLDNTGNAVHGLLATLSGPGDLTVVNNAPLDIQGINVAAGNVSIDNTGALSTSGAIHVPAGSLNLQAHSPVTVGNIVDANGNITLAALTPDGTSNITLNGNMNSAAGGISVQAYNDFIQNSHLSAALAIDVNTLAGSLRFGPGAFSVGNPVSYKVNGVSYQPPWLAATLSGGANSFVVAFLDQFQAVLDAQFVSADDPLGLRQRGREGIVVEGEICAR
jgi:filamentous hemagglutinin family protein